VLSITDHGRPLARLVPVISDDWANLIAAAQRAGADLRAVITYDTRMSDAGGLLAIPVIAPGSPPPR